MPEASVLRVLAELLLILVSAKIFGELAERLDQPAVLGELIGGVVLGTGLFSFFRPDDPSLGLMSEIGVLLLLFETGLRSDLSELLSAGPTSAAVAATGVAAPFLLGWGLMTALGRGGMEAIFVGAAMTATSVGITARVLADIGKMDAPEARIVLGAAVIDDVLGVVILSAVEGIAASGAFSWPGVVRSAVLAAVFLTAALWAGPLLTRQLVGVVRRMRVRGVLVGAAVSFAFALALAAHAAGTAMIVGAFTAGILLAGTDRREDVQAAIQPVVDVFAPVFFVMVGARVRLGTMNPLVPRNRAMLGLTALLVLAAVLGKVVSGLAVLKKGVNRWSVGVGMIPRGEVGLIFAQIGLASGAIDPAFYAAVVLMVVVTTFIAPPLLKRSLT
ncbi:MAG: cation:proton antiporter [Elusimicrobia bacterium]|nr:cation:proton antiporter [Elusimicrobiota bacterium]